MAKNRVPSYRSHKSGQARVTLDGKDHYLGAYGSAESYSRYDELVAAYLAARTPREASRPDSLNELLAQFWKHAKRRYGKTGKGPHGGAVNWRPIINLMRTKHGSESPEMFGPLAFRSLIADMMERGWSRQYANKQVSRVKQIYKWAVSHELISAVAYQRLTTVGEVRVGEMEFREAKPVAPVDDALVDATIPWLPEPVGDMVRFQRFTGARPAEVCIIRPCDVDRGGEIWVYEPKSHKTKHHGKRRPIFIGPRAQDILRPYLLRSECTFCFKPNWVRSGKKYTTDSYRRAIQRACERRCRDEELPLVKWSPNQLRHSAATAVRAEFGIETAASVLGHSNVQVTEIYAARDEQRAIEAAKKLG